MKSKTISAVLFIFVVSCPYVFTQYGQAEGGFSGSIMIGGGVVGGKPSQLDVGDDNKKVDDLNKRSESESEPVPIVDFSLSYEFASTGTTVFVGTDSGSLGVGAGVSQSLGDIGTFTITTGYSKDEVWKNPYIVGLDRKETDVESVSLDLSYEEILGTGAQLSYSYRSLDVDKDIIGESNRDLERDGAIHSGSFGYAFMFDESNILIPGMTYTKGDMDGKSNSFDSYSLDLTYVLQKQSFSIETAFSAGRSEFDKTHPVFDKIREEDEYSIISTLTLLNPLGFENYFITFIAGGNYTDSNVDFFDSAAGLLGMGIGYRF